MKLTIVDPAPCPQLVGWMQMREEMEQAKVYRFYTLCMLGTPLDHLLPNPQVMQYLRESEFGDADTRQFDIAYANQLLQDPMSFIDLMTLLMSTQMVPETILSSNYTHPLVMPILDSLMKFLQQRYGIQCCIVNDMIDIDPFQYSEFTREGYDNYIADISKFSIENKTLEQLEEEVAWADIG